jgi:hypothetical protein
MCFPVQPVAPLGNCPWRRKMKGLWLNLLRIQRSNCFRQSLPPISHRLAQRQLDRDAIRLPIWKNMTLNITHSCGDSKDHFEALGFDDSEPNMVIRFTFDRQNGWHKWRRGGWLPITLIDVPVAVMARQSPSLLHQQYDKRGDEHAR